MSVNYHVRSTSARQDYDSPEVLSFIVFDKRGLLQVLRFLFVGWKQASEDVGSSECRLETK